MLIDTHLHLGGCISPSFVWRVIQEDHRMRFLAETYEDVVSMMTFDHGEPKTFHRFLDKFRILDEIKWTEELIAEAIRSICDKLEADEIDYCWLDLSLNKYMEIGWHKKEALRFIYDVFQQYRKDRVGLVLSLKYESSKTAQRQHAKIIDDAEVADLLLGIDLVGDEAYFDGYFYAPIFADYNSAGKMTRAHVGETQPHHNVSEAINRLKVTNVAHGISILDDEDSIKSAIDNNVTFDLAVTSNFITGIVKEQHPILSMYNKGLNITIGSDDPIQCDTTLKQEYNKLRALGALDEHLEVFRSIALRNTERFLKRSLT